MRPMRVRGIFGRPFVDLAPHLDLAPLAAIHDEVCLGLAQLPVDYTGGRHRSMGIVPPSRQAECHVDYGEVIHAMSDADFETLCGLGDASAPGGCSIRAVAGSWRSARSASIRSRAGRCSG